MRVICSPPKAGSLLARTLLLPRALHPTHLDLVENIKLKPKLAPRPLALLLARAGGLPSKLPGGGGGGAGARTPDA